MLVHERSKVEGGFECKMNFQGGGGLKVKNLSWDRHGYFLPEHNEIWLEVSIILTKCLAIL